MKRYEDAIGVYRPIVRGWAAASPANSGQLGLAYAVSGRHPQALEELRILEGVANERYIPPTAFALIHGGLGNMDEAFRWMDRAVEQRDAFLTILVVSPTFDELRGDPRFNELVRRIGIESESKRMQLDRAGVAKATLAVMPFENLSNDTDTDYLSNEIPASIIDKMSGLSDLSVISRSGSFRFDPAKEDASSFGQSL